MHSYSGGESGSMLCVTWILERHLGIDFKITKAEALGECDYHHKHEAVLARQGDDKDSPGKERNKCRAQVKECREFRMLHAARG